MEGDSGVVRKPLDTLSRCLRLRIRAVCALQPTRIRSACLPLDLFRGTLGTVYLSVHCTSPRAARMVRCGGFARLILPDMLHIHDTLTRQKMPLRTAEPGVVRMYVCGMTVYDFCHLGHA